jgi:hypothetical protein
MLSLPNQISFVVPALAPRDRAAIERLCHDSLHDLVLDKGMLVELGQLDEKYEKLDSNAVLRAK